jgi:hypothetical protein
MFANSFDTILGGCRDGGSPQRALSKLLGDKLVFRVGRRTIAGALYVALIVGQARCALRRDGTAKCSAPLWGLSRVSHREGRLEI